MISLGIDVSYVLDILKARVVRGLESGKAPVEILISDCIFCNPPKSALGVIRNQRGQKKEADFSRGCGATNCSWVF